MNNHDLFLMLNFIPEARSARATTKAPEDAKTVVKSRETQQQHFYDRISREWDEAIFRVLAKA